MGETHPNLPVPKFRIGDTVFRACTVQSSRRLPCPDCLDTKVWRLISPAGTEHTTACPRCQSNYGLHEKLPPLVIVAWEPSVARLTIGSIRIDTAADDRRGWQDEPVNYMCNETGIGSGSVYKESDLFATEEEALGVATVKAALATKATDEKSEVIEAKHFSSLRVDNALQEIVRSALFNSWYAYRDLREKIDEFLGDRMTKDEFASDLDFEKRYHETHSSHPWDVLIRAARAHANDPAIATALEPFKPLQEPERDEWGALFAA